MAKRRYRMTAKRKAALRKAQLASARKRRCRRKVITATGVGVGVLGAGAGAAYLHVRKTNRIIQEDIIARKIAGIRAAQEEIRVARGAYAHAQFLKKASSPQLALPPGNPAANRKVTRLGRQKYRIGGGVAVDRQGRKRGNKKGLVQGPVAPGEAKKALHGKRVFKQGPTGIVSQKRSKGNWNAKQRATYSPSLRRQRYLEKGR